MSRPFGPRTNAPPLPKPDSRYQVAEEPSSSDSNPAAATDANASNATSGETLGSTRHEKGGQARESSIVIEFESRQESEANESVVQDEYPIGAQTN